MIHQLKKLLRDDRGATAIEYGLILCMIFLAIVGAVTAFGNQNTSQWNAIASKVALATSQANA